MSETRELERASHYTWLELFLLNKGVIHDKLVLQIVLQTLIKANAASSGIHSFTRLAPHYPVVDWFWHWPFSHHFNEECLTNLNLLLESKSD